jgi:hypothetical protein
MPARTQEQGSTGRRVSALLLARSRAVSPTTETDEGTVVLRALASAQMRAPDWRTAARLLRTTSRSATRPAGAHVLHRRDLGRAARRDEM